jgi:hypothetical protein
MFLAFRFALSVELCVCVCGCVCVFSYSFLTVCFKYHVIYVSLVTGSWGHSFK